MKTLDEFKKFLARGNVIDLAIGVIIGTAFGKIVSSLVTDVIMPPIGLLLGKVDFSSLYINLSGHTYSSLEAAKKAGAPTINYGVFINNVINFIIIAFVIFCAIKMLQKATPKKETAVITKTCPYCFSSIPIKATKCAHCTADLPDESNQQPIHTH
ncbi:large conductance mechanosensitive channel protein MscL [Sporolactobacillus terrae]|uniref:Large-conductance mechanosensitive channel n=1 Tax=Sporolactobacillus terrae TaxID=269673 RepID=A0ABX5Q660_9BACL|nr:large conductance mechanosensitive channel protein MscL [Sporolactobacillus terrae]QAA22128.1 large conductance mechanosensitive channel protein MscL [Sporolactobacillus terrae]QAA25100.1 large conductance mechanosensitive channel protein MscL [Sporolactobacillus terrae]UAK16920.1 large conductance mechanosensitive channel protein MscL [Sporolactobacillus terrae]